MKNNTHTKRKLTYRTGTIFRVFQVNKRQNEHWLGATGKVAYVANVSICFRSKDEERDFCREKNGTRCKGGRGLGFLPSFHSRNFQLALWLSLLTLFSETAWKCLPHKLQEWGKNDVIFFLLFTPPLGTTLSPAFAHVKTRKKKGETASPSEKCRHRAGTFPYPLPFSGLFHH